MKKITTLLFLALLLLAGTASMAQVAINTDNSQPDASAMLDIKSTDAGMLIPRLTTLQRDAIGSPATGLMVFDTDENDFYYFNGTTWTPIGDAAGAGKFVDGTDPLDAVYMDGKVGIGTTTPVSRLNTFIDRDVMGSTGNSATFDYKRSNGGASSYEIGKFRRVDNNFGSGRGVNITLSTAKEDLSNEMMLSTIQSAPVIATTGNEDSRLTFLTKDPTHATGFGILSAYKGNLLLGSDALNSVSGERLQVNKGSIMITSGLSTNNSDAHTGIKFTTDNLNYIAQIKTYRGTSSANLGLSFWTTNSGVQQNSIQLNPNGNVGIGTTAPQDMLDVAGVVRSTRDNYSGVRLKNNTTSELWTITNIDASSGNGLFFQNSTLGGYPLVIKNSGNVGIGTTTPTAKLQVVGLKEYADDAAAGAAGLTAGAFYHSAGVVKVKL